MEAGWSLRDRTAASGSRATANPAGQPASERDPAKLASLPTRGSLPTLGDYLAVRPARSTINRRVQPYKGLPALVVGLQGKGGP